MTPTAIFLFLTGALMAWAFRVWILIPITLFAVGGAAAASAFLGTTSTFGQLGLIALAPQGGYAFGLFARYALSSSRATFAEPDRSEVAFGETLKRRSIDSQV